MVAATTLAKYANDNFNLFVELYEGKYGKKPVLNRHKLKWAFQDMVKDLGNKEAKEVIHYYFDRREVGHPVENLLYNYEVLYQTLKEREQDDEKRALLRKETERRVREWEARHGNN